MVVELSVRMPLVCVLDLRLHQNTDRLRQIQTEMVALNGHEQKMCGEGESEGKEGGEAK